MHKIEIFSSPLCIYCTQAKTFISNKGLAYEELDIFKDENRAEMERRLPRNRSIPQIFIEGEHIGGFEDLEILDRDGYFDQFINNTGEA